MKPLEKAKEDVTLLIRYKKIEVKSRLESMKRSDMLFQTMATQRQVKEIETLESILENMEKV